MRYDVFISYKNDGSGEIFAEKLAKDLKGMGYSVYFNSHERRSGPFDERIREAVAGCKDFVAVVSAGYLNQITRPNPSREDWIREEILEARRHGSITITPIYLRGTTPPSLSEFSADKELSFFPTLDGVDMPGEGYDVSPLESLTSRLQSRRDGRLDYRDVANGNPRFQVREELRRAYEEAFSGSYEAMYLIGLMTFYGMCPSESSGVIRDFSESYRWLKRVSDECPEQNLRNQANTLIGMMYYQGEGTPEGQSYEMSLEYHEKAAANNYSSAHAFFMREYGIGCVFDMESLDSMFRHAADSGDNGAWYNYGLFCESLGRFPEAIELYQSMNPITAKAHYRLGTIYRNGTYCDPPVRDYEKASLHFRIAMEGGLSEAARDLGTLYLRPTGGFPKDFAKAQQCLEVAAEAGDRVAQYLLGYLFEFHHAHREGVDDVEEAIRLYELAAGQGEMMSATHLASLYQLPQLCNYEKAFRYCKMAADAGEPKALFMLGNMYLMGRGCQFDLHAAQRCLTQSKQRGFDLADGMIKIVERLIGELESAVPEWLS